MDYPQSVCVSNSIAPVSPILTRQFIVSPVTLTPYYAPIRTAAFIREK